MYMLSQCYDFLKINVFLSINEELEVLRSIFSEELEVTDERSGNLCIVRTHLCPHTGEVEEEQFVFLDVAFTVQCETVSWG